MQLPFITGKLSMPLLDLRVLVFVASLALLCMDSAQLVFLLIGGMTYALLQVFGAPPQPSTSKKLNKLKLGASVVKERTPQNVAAVLKAGAATTSGGLGSQRRNVALATQTGMPAPSPTPVAAPTAHHRSGFSGSVRPVVPEVFSGTGWDAEVEELAARLAPTPKSREAVEGVARFVESALAGFMPEAEVMAFACSNWTASHGACRVAVPEVEVVVRAAPEALLARLCRRQMASQGGGGADADGQKLLKLAVRAFTEKLVATGHVKFRRSAFRGSEPKVTLLVLDAPGFYHEAMPIDFSVNAKTPVRHAAFLSVCESVAPDSLALVLLVRRWAKDRGICHAAKGHLSPYAWALLVAYFLQVGYSGEEGGALLPPLDAAFAHCLAPDNSGQPQGATCSGTSRSEIPRQKSLGTLFKDFVHFYSVGFCARTEAVCVRSGKRSPLPASLPLHVVVDGGLEGPSGVVAHMVPSIEDPLDPARNLGAELTAWGLTRMKQELLRACRLTAQGASLGELLELWAPPEEESKTVD